RPAPRRAVRPRTASEKEFCALGPAAEVFITGAAAAGNTRLGPELAELNTLRAAYGEQAFLDAWTGRWRSAGGAPPTCGPSWLPGRGRPIPGPPGTRWCSSCPWSRSGRWPTTPSVGCHDRGRGAAAPDLAEGLRRLKLAAMRRLARSCS